MDPRAEILVIGKEMLAGARQERNVAPLARFLHELGFTLTGARLLDDDRVTLAAAIRAVRTDLLVITGGLGCTRDDVTRPAVARAFGLRLRVHEEVRDRVRERFRARHLAFTPRYRGFTLLPETAVPVPNPTGLATGFLVPGRPACLVLPGVPGEVAAILRETAGPALRRAFPRLSPRRLFEIGLAGVNETDIEDRLLDLPPFRDGAISILPGMGTVSLLVPDERLVAIVRRRFGANVFTTVGESLEAVVLDALAARGQTLAVAESCTGGGLGERLTRVPGASRVFSGGIIAYADAAKTRLLGVPAALLRRHGAVSAPVARAMAVGARRRLRSDWALALTGVAGPGGGTPAKPVGTVHIALAGPRGCRLLALARGGDREMIRGRAAAAALDLLRRRLPS